MALSVYAKINNSVQSHLSNDSCQNCQFGNKGPQKTKYISSWN